VRQHHHNALQNGTSLLGRPPGMLGSPEFAQERDNRSKKAKFIFREIGSIQATRLSPQPPPRNRVSRGRSLLGGDRPPFQGAARA